MATKMTVVRTEKGTYLEIPDHTFVQIPGETSEEKSQWVVCAIEESISRLEAEVREKGRDAVQKRLDEKYSTPPKQ